MSPERRNQKPMEFQESFYLLMRKIIVELRRSGRRDAPVASFEHGDRTLNLQKDGVWTIRINGTAVQQIQTPRSILGGYTLIQNPEYFLERVTARTRQDRILQLGLEQSFYVATQGKKLQKELLGRMNRTLRKLQGPKKS